MAKIKNELSSYEIKGYINKLYDEIVEEMDSFINIRQSKQEYKPFSHVFSRLNTNRPPFSKPPFSSKQESFKYKSLSLNSLKDKKPSSHFFSSFDDSQSLKGFSSRKYFNKQSTHDTNASPNTPSSKDVSSFFENSPWQQALKSVEETSPPLEIPEKSSHLFEQTTPSLIPSLKASLGLFKGLEKEEENPDNSFVQKPAKSRFKAYREEVLKETEINGLLCPMMGMTKREKEDDSNAKSFSENDLIEEKKENTSSQTISNEHDNLWQYLEQEESLKDLFAHIKIFPSSKDEAKPISLANKEETIKQTEDFLREELHEDPFFTNLEKTLESPIVAKPEGSSSTGQNEVLSHKSSMLSWPGELRWHVLARKDLDLFKTHLPAGFVLCDGKASLGSGPFSVSQETISGKLPNWVEEIDEDHIVVGILKTSPG